MRTRPLAPPWWWRRTGLPRVALVLSIGSGLGLAPVQAQVSVPVPAAGPVLMQVPAGTRQVTVFGILATPNDPTLDPKLQPIAPQLRRLFPNHGFRLLGTETQRVGSGESLGCALGPALAVQAQLVNPLDANGKVQFRVQLDRDQQIDFATVVTTPLNQLFFCDKVLPDGTRVILGIGARE